MTAADIARLQDGRVTPENVRPCARAAYRRKQRQGARCRSKRFPLTNRNRRGRNGRKPCARSSAANRGFARLGDNGDDYGASAN